jgi:hypothetical protein
MSNNWNTKESEKRVADFMKEYEALCLKYHVELMSFPQFMPNVGKGFDIGTFIQPVDRTDQPIPSDMSIL